MGILFCVLPLYLDYSLVVIYSWLSWFQWKYEQLKTYVETASSLGQKLT